MSNQKLGILAVVAAVMVLWATVQSRLSRSGGGGGASGPAYLIQGLDPADIERIVVGAGDDSVTIERQGSGFVVTDEANYPADPKQINDLITKSLDIKTSESYTDNPDNHAELEVTEEKARHVVTFTKANGSLLTGVVIGKSQEAGQSTFVRLAASDEVYLAQSVPWFRSRALDYVNQDITSVKREDVNTVTVTTPEVSYTLRKGQGADDVVMENVPAEKKLKDSDAKSVFHALTNLRFDDVNAPSEMEGLDFDHQYVCRLNDSTEYRLELAKKGDKTYLKCQAEFGDKTPVTMKLNQQESEEELKKKEAKLQAQETAQKFTLRHKAWVYEIPDWKAKYLTQPQSELLEDQEEEAAEAAEPAEPADVPDEGTEAVPADVQGPAVGPAIEAPGAPAEPNVPAEPNAVEEQP